MSLLGPGLTFQKGPFKYKKNQKAPVQTYPWKGGGVAAGGQEHAGNGNWMNVMNPQATPMTFPQPTSKPSIYASIVTIHDIYDPRMKRGPPGTFKGQAQRNGNPQPSVQKMGFGQSRKGQDNEQGVLRNANQEKGEELLEPPIDHLFNNIAPSLLSPTETSSNNSLYMDEDSNHSSNGIHSKNIVGNRPDKGPQSSTISEETKSAYQEFTGVGRQPDPIEFNTSASSKNKDASNWVQMLENHAVELGERNYELMMEQQHYVQKIHDAKLEGFESATLNHNHKLQELMSSILRDSGNS